MADSTIARPAQPTLAAGLAAVLGLFAGLCAVFAGGATLVDGYGEIAQARWPLISAVVDRAEVAVVARKEGGGSLWNLRTRVHYEVDGLARTATLLSRTAFSEIEAARLQAAAEQQPQGSRIDIRYDPSREDRAVFASADLASDRSRTDRILFAGFAIGSAVLLLLARYLRARAARAGSWINAAQQARLALAIFAVGPGVAVAGYSILRVLRAGQFNCEQLMGVPFGLTFVFAGALACLPPQYSKVKELLATLAITCFAMTFDWVAFGPGERQFTGSVTGSEFIPSELMGRIAFGIFAVILDVSAVLTWIGQFRRMFGPSAPTARPPVSPT